MVTCVLAMVCIHIVWLGVLLLFVAFLRVPAKAQVLLKDFQALNFNFNFEKSLELSRSKAQRLLGTRKLH